MPIELNLEQKSPVRVIQHLSCTGGSLISKCLAAMPDVLLLSEVNPFCRLHVDSERRFAPTDLTYLAIQGRFPFVDQLSEKIFNASLDVISKHANSLGKYLVIREHSHSHFLIGDAQTKIRTVKTILEQDYQVLSVLTVRHPVDSYNSMISNEWLHFNPKTFDEYCRRCQLFLDDNKGSSVYKYEEFVSEPQKVMRGLCKTLNLPFNENFQSAFNSNIMGDSGRTSDVISKRERREINDEFRQEINASTEYIRLCEMLRYERC